MSDQNCYGGILSIQAFARCRLSVRHNAQSIYSFRCYALHGKQLTSIPRNKEDVVNKLYLHKVSQILDKTPIDLIFGSK